MQEKTLFALSKREKIADGIHYTAILDKKFTTNGIHISFATELSEKIAPHNALALSIIASTSKKYPTLALLSAKLSELYGASLHVSVSKRGDIGLLNFYINTIENKYTFDGENIAAELVDIIFDCIFNPNIIDGEFEKDIFNFRKQDILDTIDSEINNKRGYAIMQASKKVFINEPAAVTAYGSREYAEKMTSKDVYNAYRTLLKTAIIEIFVVSPEGLDLKNQFAETFSKIERESLNLIYNTPSPLKSQPEFLSEKLDINQAKMVLAFKGNADKYCAKLMSAVLGELPSSKLFMNVREKLSLCYYCASGYQDSKKTLMIDSGVETENIDKARVAIIAQLEDMKNGNITGEELSNAKLAVINALKAVGDTPTSVSHWYLRQLQNGSAYSPEDLIEIYNPITIDGIVEAAKAFTLDSVYTVVPN